MKKTMKLILMTMVALILGMTTVQAESFNFIVTPSKTTVEEGDTITISLKLSNINAGELGINSVVGKISYDKNIFENVSISSKNNWSITFNDEADNEAAGTMAAVILAGGVKDDQEIGEMKLTVKKGLKSQNTTISFTGLSTNDGENAITETDKAVSIKVNGTIKDDTNNPATDDKNQGSQKEPNGNGGTSNSGDKKPNSETPKTPIKDNVAKGPMPQTGIMGSIILIPIVVIAVAGLIIYIKYHKIEK